MPKMKTHSGAKKRFKPTSGGTQIKRACQNKNHILNKKPRERKRKLRQGDYVGDSQERAIRTLLQTGGKPKARMSSRATRAYSGEGSQVRTNKSASTGDSSGLKAISPRNDNKGGNNQ